MLASSCNLHTGSNDAVDRPCHLLYLMQQECALSCSGTDSCCLWAAGKLCR